MLFFLHFIKYYQLLNCFDYVLLENIIMDELNVK